MKTLDRVVNIVKINKNADSPGPYSTETVELRDNLAIIGNRLKVLEENLEIVVGDQRHWERLLGRTLKAIRGLQSKDEGTVKALESLLVIAQEASKGYPASC